MFDIGFLEIIVILVITLMVIGPERMPEVARKIGQFVGKTRHFINSVKDNSEISDAVRELQDSINLEEEKRSVEKVTSSLQDDISQIQQEFEIDQSITRPFGQSDDSLAIDSQFNKAPAQPSQPAVDLDQTPDSQSQQTDLDTPKTTAETNSETTDHPQTVERPNS